MMRDDDDDSFEGEEPARPPAYNEQRFNSKIEADLGYAIDDHDLKAEIEEEVYNPKPKPEFGYDPTVTGAAQSKPNAPLAQPAAYATNQGAFAEAEEDVQQQQQQPTNLVASSRGYVMPKNMGDEPAEDVDEEIDEKFGYRINPNASNDSGETDDDDEGPHKPYSALDTVDEDSEYDVDSTREANKERRNVGGTEDRIKVAVRMRPMTKDEMASKNKKKKESGPDAFMGWTVKDDGEFDVMIQKGARSKVEGKSMFHVDRVYEERDFLEALYSDICEPIATAVINGQHGTIFGYGATGGGKSHTIQGGKGVEGIIQLASKDLLERIAQDTSREYTVKASYFEIYNEQVRDLMGQEEEDANPKSRRATAVVTTVNKLNIELPILNIREDPKTGDVNVDAQHTVVSNVQNVIRVLHKGNRNRATEKTLANKFSSRSHAIFRLTVESHERLEGVTDDVEGIRLRVASLNFVDLAGSENSAKASTSGSRKREGGKINQSLLSLSQVINQLSLPKKKQPKHINYRDSKLTRILQSQLSGNAAIAIICCVSPAKKCVEETRQTLKFGHNAKRIKLKPRVNEVVDERVIIDNLKKELHDTRLQMQELQENIQRLEALPPPAPSRPVSEFPLLEAFMARMTESVRTADFVDAMEDLSELSAGGGLPARYGSSSDAGGGDSAAASDRGSNDEAPAAEEEDEDDIDAFRRQILAKFMSEAAEEGEGYDPSENADTTINDTTVNDTTVNGGETTDYDTSMNRTYTDETMETHETTDPSKSEQPTDPSQSEHTKDSIERAPPGSPNAKDESNFSDVFRSKPAEEPRKSPETDGKRPTQTHEIKAGKEADSKHPIVEKRSFIDDDDSSDVRHEQPDENDLNLIEKFREEILEKFRDEIVDEEAAHELDENAQNVAVIANELINKFKKEIVYKYKDEFPDFFVKRVEVDLSAQRVGENGIVGRVIERDATGQSTEDSSAGGSGGSVEKFEDEFEDEANADDGDKPHNRRSLPQRAFSSQTDRAVINGKPKVGIPGGKAPSRTETDPSTLPINSSIGQGTSGSVSSDLSSDVADRDKGSDMSPEPANPPGTDDDEENELIPPGEIAIAKGLAAATASLDSKMRIKFLEEKLAATDELVETLFVELENAKTFIRELVFENAGNAVDQSAALFGPAGTSGVNVVDEQILNQCEILKFAIYTSLLFFVFGQHELFLATVFFLWLSLEVATKA